MKLELILKNLFGGDVVIMQLLKVCDDDGGGTTVIGVAVRSFW